MSGKPDSVRVAMTLAAEDVANADKTDKWFGGKGKAAAVGKALSLSSAIIDQLEKGRDLYVREKNGEFIKLVIPKE